jgi:hypothetical protein
MNTLLQWVWKFSLHDRTRFVIKVLPWDSFVNIFTIILFSSCLTRWGLCLIFLGFSQPKSITSKYMSGDSLSHCSTFRFLKAFSLCVLWLRDHIKNKCTAITAYILVSNFYVAKIPTTSFNNLRALKPFPREFWNALYFSQRHTKD